MFSIRVPVVDQRGVPLMPCTPPKARALLKSGKAHPKRNKLGMFYLQLTYDREPANQLLVVGIDPGSSFEGYSVVGTKETVCHLMLEAPTHVKKAVETRRRMRRARRFRLWRRPCRSNNRLAHKHRLPPSTRSRWEAKARIVRHLATILPLTDGAVEDVQAGTRSLGFKRGTLVQHPAYGHCTVGGYDRETQRLSLHTYKTNKRLTQRAKPADCRRLTTIAFRCWLIPVKSGRHTTKTKGVALPPRS
jgi:hypothetical protein